MSALAMEGALDLSAKPSGEVKSTSPVPSITSDTDSQLGDHHGERSESVSSDGHDTDTSTSTAVKPILGLTSGSFPKPHSPKVSSQDQPSPDPQHSPGGIRPFKMYPFEPLPGIYSQMAAAAATAAGSPSAVYPSALPNTSFPMGMIDPMATVSLSSPIMSYLQSRKRRMEAKTNSSPPGSMLDGECDAKKMKSPELGMDGEPSSKDEHYWERRRKNNEAAKRSRDARRAKEEEIALRAAFLEQENLKLRAQVAILKNETAKLHYMLYNRM